MTLRLKRKHTHSKKIVRENSRVPSFFEKHFVQLWELLNAVSILPSMVLVLYALNCSAYFIFGATAAYLLGLLPFFISKRIKKDRKMKSNLKSWDFFILMTPDICALILAIVFVSMLGVQSQTVFFLFATIVFSIVSGYRKWSFLRGTSFSNASVAEKKDSDKVRRMDTRFLGFLRFSLGIIFFCAWLFLKQFKEGILFTLVVQFPIVAVLLLFQALLIWTHGTRWRERKKARAFGIAFAIVAAGMALSYIWEAATFFGGYDPPQVFALRILAPGLFCWMSLKMFIFLTVKDKK